MIETNQIKNYPNDVKSVNKTLFEMIGPQSDGLEEKKLKMILRLNQSNTNFLENNMEANAHLYPSEMNSEKTFEFIKDAKKKKEEGDKVCRNNGYNNLSPITNLSLNNSGISLYNQLELKRSCLFESSLSNNKLTKTAFNPVKDSKLNSILSVNSREYLCNQFEMKEDFMNINSFPTSMKNNLGFYESVSYKKPDVNGPSGMNRHLMNNFNLNNLFNNNFNQPLFQNTGGKPMLFTYVKNTKKHKRNQSGNNNYIGADNNQVISNNYQTEMNHSSFSESNSNIGNVNKNPKTPGISNLEDKINNSSSTNHSSIATKNEDYLEMLILAAESMIEKEITKLNNYEENGENSNISISNLNSYLNSSTFDKCKTTSSSSEEGMSDSQIRCCDNKVCRESGPKNSNMWVKCKNLKSKPIWLCVSCHKAWKNYQYCFYCNVIYRDNSSNYTDTKSWICCDDCEMWHHIQCEEAKGYYSDIIELNKDPYFKYVCPLCRKNSLDTFEGNTNNTNANTSTNLNTNTSLKQNSKDRTSDNPIEIKSKRKYNFKKNLTNNKKPDKNSNESNAACNNLKYNTNLNSSEILGQKTKSDNFDYSKFIFYSSDLKFSKRKSESDTRINQNLNNSLSSFSILNCYDNRDIYHDFYKISNINAEDKKK